MSSRFSQEFTSSRAALGVGSQRASTVCEIRSRDQRLKDCREHVSRGTEPSFDRSGAFDPTSTRMSVTRCYRKIATEQRKSNRTKVPFGFLLKCISAA